MGGATIGCGPTAEPTSVTGHLSGRITVNTAVDSTADYSNFRVLVAQGRERQIDTLGHALTMRDGSFATPVVAPERGVYLLTVWGRNGRQRLFATEYVVADADSARLSVEFPISRHLVPVRSRENAALLTYRNTMALHQQALMQRLQQVSYRENAMLQSVRQTSSILWDMRATYPDTYATQLASVESLALLEGWNDSLVVARAAEIAPANPRFGEAARIGRRAMARVKGQQAALTFLDDAYTRAQTDAQKAAVQATRLRAHLDSLERDKALAVAEHIQDAYPDTPWADWADRAAYEAETLLPGMPAPDFTVRTIQGDTLSLNDLYGRPVLLEFYQPGEDLYVQQMPTRNALHVATRPDSVAFLSVSLQPDTLLNRAFFEGRQLPGQHVIAPGGLEEGMAQTYNVAVVPTRFLIDPEGRIVDKYVGSALLAVQDDLANLPPPAQPGSAISPPPSTP